MYISCFLKTNKLFHIHSCTTSTFDLIENHGLIVVSKKESAKSPLKSILGEPLQSSLSQLIEFLRPQ